MEFVRHLGRHRGADGAALTLPELGALVVTAGRDAGFRVQTEMECGPNGAHRIDCAWCATEGGAPVVVWEFDARDVPCAHLIGAGNRLGTFQKLREFQDAMRIQALYTLRGEAKREKSYLRNPRFQAVLQRGGEIHLHTDAELIAGKLEIIITQARRQRRR